MAEPQYIKKTWRIVRTIGEGGMGTVYEVCHRDVPRLRRAVKQLKPEFAARRDILKRFSQEVMLMASLDDADNIVKVLDVDEEEGFGTFIMMQLVDGPSLRQVIDQRGALPLDEVLRLGLEIASALHLAHTNNVIHRDIKAHNILVDLKKGKAFLTDFGIAKELHEGGEETMDGTKTEMILGTPRYCSPEQLRNERPPHARWDVYALGAVLYEAATGLRFLRQLKSNSEIITQVAFNPNFAPTLDYPPPVPVELRQLIADCIARDPGQRLTSAAELVRRLEECRLLHLQRGAAPATTAIDVPLPPVEDLEPTQQESYSEPRQALRTEVERRIGALGHLEEVLATADLPMGTGPSSETLVGSLRDVSLSEEAGHFSEALARLETLREKLGDAERNTQRAAREDFEEVGAGLTRRWEDLAGRAGQLLATARRAVVEERMAALMQAIDDAQWTVAGRRSSDARAAVDSTEGEVRSGAASSVGVVLDDVAARVGALRGLDPGAAPSDAAVEEQRAQVAAQLEAGQFAAAIEAAEQLRAAVGAATEDAERRADERGRALRDGVERAREAAAAAQRRAAELPSPSGAQDDAERLMNEAAQLVAEQRWADAETRYGEACAAWTALEERSRALADEAKRHTLLERCAALQEEIGTELDRLGELEARTATRDLSVDAPRAEALRAALTAARDAEQSGALEPALERLQQTRDHTAAAAAAHEAAIASALAPAARELISAWEELAERAGGLATPAQLRELEQLAAALQGAIEIRAWDEAERQERAGRLWLEQATAAIRAAAAQAVGEQLETIRTGAEALAHGGAGATGVDLEEVSDRAGRALAGGDFSGALRETAAARDAIAAQLARRRQTLTAQVEGARAELDALVEGLDVEAARVVAGSAVGDAEQARVVASRAEQGGDLAAAAAAYGQAIAAYGAAARQLEAAEQKRQRALLAQEVHGLLEQTESAPPELVAAARAAADAALAESESVEHGAAVAALSGARDGLASCLAGAPLFAAAVEARATAARAEEQLGDLQITDAERRTVTQTVEVAAAAFARRAWGESRDRYGEAAAACGRLREEAEARARAAEELARERAAARQVVAAAVDQARGAPGALVGEALAAAEGARVDGEASVERLRSAASDLTGALADRPAFAAADESRAAAQAAEQRAVAAGVKARRLKAARRLLQEGDAALARRQWSVAAELCSAAASAFDAAAAAVPAAIRAPGVRPTNRALLYGVPALAIAIVAVMVAERSGIVDLFPEAAPAPPAVRKVEAPPAPRAAEPAPLAAPPHIASFAPPAGDLALNENQRQRFTVELAGVSGPPPELTWSLDGKTVAKGAGETAWEYAPGYDAAGGPYEVAVRVGAGAGPDQTRRWKVSVADTDRPPVLQANPEPGTAIVAAVGKTARFKVDASDADGDPLTYEWTVDGQKQGGNQPVLDLPVTGDQKVALAVSDGRAGEPVRLEWQIKSKLGDLVMAPQPGRIDSVAFKQGQQFKLVAPASERQTPIQIAWAVDGTRAADGPFFSFRADDPAQVSANPVKVTATARDDRGRQYDYAWTFKVVPPAPQITAAVPAASGPIEVTPGGPTEFTLTAAPPIGNQRFEYVFKVNGKETRGPEPRYALTPAEGRDYTVVAAIEDNYRQRSKERTWSLRAPASVPAAAAALDVSTLVRAWLNDYLAALNGKNVAAQASLLGLTPDQARQLEELQRARNELQVSFNNVRIEAVGADRAKATYQRVDRFKDPNGTDRAPSAAVEQTFRIVNGRAQLVK